MEKKLDKISQETSTEEKLVTEQRAEKFDLPDIRSYFKVITINTVDLAKKQSSETDLHIHRNLIHCRDGIADWWEEDELFKKLRTSEKVKISS